MSVGTDAFSELASDRFVAIARIVRPQGRRGEVVAEMMTDFPERFGSMQHAFLESAGAEPQFAGLEKCWPHQGRIVLKFAGVDSIEQAERLRGLHVFILREERVQLAEHRYYVSDLEGCRVLRQRDGSEQELGVVTEVERTGGTEVLHVRRDAESPEILIPLAQEICTRIDIAAKKIWINPPDELLELNQ